MNSRHVCLSCILRHGRRTLLASLPTSRPKSIFQRHAIASAARSQTKPPHRVLTLRHSSQEAVAGEVHQSQDASTDSARSPVAEQSLALKKEPSKESKKTSKKLELSDTQLSEIHLIKSMFSALKDSANTVYQRNKTDPTCKEVLDHVFLNHPEFPRLLSIIESYFESSGDQPFKAVLQQMEKNVFPYHETNRAVRDEEARQQLRALGILRPTQKSPQPLDGSDEPAERRQSTHDQKEIDGEFGQEKSSIPNLDVSTQQTLHARSSRLRPLDLGELNVPKLSFDLSRVLFNPGVYQLQDPRSRVYNFDPYLQKVMPVSEFNFDALNKYVTSSEDDYLRTLARELSKRYVGSSSSMSSALSHFHFLLSSWRPLNLTTLSKGFDVESPNFTRMTRAPSAIFLRYKDGVYAVDADKEFDSANILMSLGRSLEKLLTLEKDEFERYRKSTPQEQQALDSQPEQYHYSELGQFLLRSQLDAYDPRLPGSGVFDLKTRAVVSVRMSLGEHERGVGYQIKQRQGSWESYEREYYDMIRSAFLKYSLQVRMGRMDGIFVVFHNVESIFGFQYVSLPELDQALHGQMDPTVGDREFGFSVRLMNDIFDRATKAFPERSIRFHFDTRESAAKVRDKVHRMYIFAEPMSEEQIQGIQKGNEAEIRAIEEKLRRPQMANAEDEYQATPRSEMPTRQDNAADTSFLDSLAEIDLKKPPETRPGRETEERGAFEPVPEVLGFELVVRSVVNGKSVVRPENLNGSDDWVLEYNVNPMTEKIAQVKYSGTKLRRKAAMRMDAPETQLLNSYFQKLFRMSKEGAQWRRQQDEADAQKGKVVLYENGSGG